MGSPLGVLFANVYMTAVEERVFQNRQKPTIYARYIDDIFVTTKDEEDLKNLQDVFQQNSVLRFTIEKSVDHKIPFLDTMVQKEANKFITSVYTKPTNIGRCLNARGECPDTYKKSVISAYVNRALTHCTSWRLIHAEFERIRQLLTNNGYNGDMIEECIKKKLDSFQSNDIVRRNEEEYRKITIYHRIHFSTAYKKEAEVIRNIIQRGVLTTNPEEKLDIRIYCKPNQLASLIMRNSTVPPKEKEVKTNVVYKFKCPEGNCESPENTYIGHTSTTLRRRLTYHRNQGAIFQHFTDKHDRKPTVNELLESTSILAQESNSRRRIIIEAVYIKLQKPSLNIQTSSFYILPSTRRQRDS